MTRDFAKPGRSAAYGTRAMIATSHPQASLAGLDVMRRGGSAVDAAIVACAMLGVVEPAMTGIGGDCFAIVAKPGEAPTTINGSGRAPAGAIVEQAAAQGVAAIEDNSPFAVTVPGAVDAWCALHRDYGRLGFAELLEPAAKMAEEGYPLAPRVAFDWQRNADRLRRHAETAAAFLRSGEAPGVGDVHRQPALARTLRAIAQEGRAAFYEGEVAQELVATLKARGGTHTLDDFAEQRADYMPPVSGQFRDVEVLECPPNGQGATALLMLAALDGWDSFERSNDPHERAHVFAQVSRAAYALRDRAIADPASMPIDVAEFLSSRSVDHVRGFLDTSPAPPNALSRAAPWETDTICLSVVDQDGLAVSFINSLFNAFGSTIFAPKSGVMLHNRGTSFSLDPKHPNALGPRKRPMHTIIPGMVMKAGRALMPFGVMGGQYQSAGHTGLLVNLFKDGLDLQSAIDAPRLFGYGPTVQVETGIGPGTVAHLEARGHRIERLDSPLGGAQAVWIDHDRGVLVGGSDPRKDGCALGY